MASKCAELCRSATGAAFGTFLAEEARQMAIRNIKENKNKVYGYTNLVDKLV